MSQPALGARQVRLFRNNRNQAVRIPVEFELPGKEAMIWRDGHRLIIEALPSENPNAGLIALLKSWEPLDEAFPDVKSTLLPLKDVNL